MKRLNITNDHGWTPRELRKQERNIHVLRSTWSEVGRQKRVPTPTFGHHARVSVFGSVNIHDGDAVVHQAEATNATTFLGFLL
nr:hypothetical protein [Geobacillus sp. LEMMY01]